MLQCQTGWEKPFAQFKPTQMDKQMRFFTLEQPIHTRTIGGLDATITGIETETPDIIIGTIKAPSGPFHSAWNESGLCCNMGEEANLDPLSAEIQELLKAVKELG